MNEGKKLIDYWREDIEGQEKIRAKAQVEARHGLKPFIVHGTIKAEEEPEHCECELCPGHGIRQYALKRVALIVWAVSESDARRKVDLGVRPRDEKLVRELCEDLGVTADVEFSWPTGYDLWEGKEE